MSHKTLEQQIREIWKSRNLSVIEIKVINVGEDRFQWTVIAEPSAEEPGCPLSNAMGGEEPCSHPPDQQYQVQADITDDTVDPGFYCRLCRKKVSEYGPTEEPKKSWPPRDANGLTDQQKYPVIEEPGKEKEEGVDGSL